MWRGYEKSSLFSTVLHWPVCLKSFVILADMVQVFLYSEGFLRGSVNNPLTIIHWIRCSSCVPAVIRPSPYLIVVLNKGVFPPDSSVDLCLTGGQSGNIGYIFSWCGWFSHCTVK